MMGNVSLTNRGLDWMNYETDPALTALEGGGVRRICYCAALVTLAERRSVHDSEDVQQLR